MVLHVCNCPSKADLKCEGMIWQVRALKAGTCAGGVDISMLVEAVKMIDGRCKTEASGNVTLSTVGAIAQSGCDFISCGALTHSVMALDISFNIDVNL